jgi:hypothetical protein
MDYFHYPRDLTVLRTYRQIVQSLRDQDAGECEAFDEWLQQIREREAALRDRN